MSKISKGNAFQDWIAKWLKKEYPTCVVHNQKSVARQIKIPGRGAVWVSKRNDIFGEIDLIKIDSLSKPLFIQATCDAHVERKEKPLEALPWNLMTCDVEVWMKRKSGIVRIKRLNTYGQFVTIGKIVRGEWHSTAIDEEEEE